jgi:hypothetical protein
MRLRRCAWSDPNMHRTTASSTKSAGGSVATVLVLVFREGQGGKDLRKHN